MRPRTGDLCLYKVIINGSTRNAAWFIVSVSFENVVPYGSHKSIEQCNVLGLSFSIEHGLSCHHFAWWEPYEWHNAHLTARLTT